MRMSFRYPTDALSRGGHHADRSRSERDCGGFREKGLTADTFWSAMHPVSVTPDLLHYVLGMLAAVPEDLTFGDVQVERWPIENPLFVFQTPIVEKVFEKNRGEEETAFHAIQPGKCFSVTLCERTGDPGLSVSLYEPSSDGDERLGLLVRDAANNSTALTELVPWALSQVLSQRIVIDTVAQYPSRQMERSARRRGVPPVRLLDLRSPQRATATWSGHPRMATPLGGSRALAQTLVPRHSDSSVDLSPYIKGPDDKPLDVRPTVWKADAS